MHALLFRIRNAQKQSALISGCKSRALGQKVHETFEFYELNMAIFWWCIIIIHSRFRYENIVF